MKITVKLFATLRLNRQKSIDVDVPEDTTPLIIAQMLNIPLKDVAIIMINGRGANPESRLNDADVLALFPPVGGG